MSKEKIEKIIWNIAFCSASYALAMREGGISPNKIAGIKIASDIDWPITANETQKAIIDGASDAIKQMDILLTTTKEK